MISIVHELHLDVCSFGHTIEQMVNCFLWDMVSPFGVDIGLFHFVNP